MNTEIFYSPSVALLFCAQILLCAYASAATSWPNAFLKPVPVPLIMIKCNDEENKDTTVLKCSAAYFASDSDTA
jgi:hypothetical protein